MSQCTRCSVTVDGIGIYSVLVYSLPDGRLSVELPEQVAISDADLLQEIKAAGCVLAAVLGEGASDDARS